MNISDLTEKQKDYFLKCLSAGIACGLQHRYECLVGSLRNLSLLFPGKPDEEENYLIDAFLAFEKTLAGSPEEEEFLKSLDADGFMQMIDEWYKK